MVHTEYDRRLPGGYTVEFGTKPEELGRMTLLDMSLSDLGVVVQAAHTEFLKNPDDEEHTEPVSEEPSCLVGVVGMVHNEGEAIFLFDREVHPNAVYRSLLEFSRKILIAEQADYA